MKPKIPQIFKPEQFAFPKNITCGPISYSDLAQQIFESWLKEHGKVVYSSNHLSFYDKNLQKNADLYAYVVCETLNEKKECEHEPTATTEFGYFNNKSYVCSNCGKNIKATWSVE